MSLLLTVVIPTYQRPQLLQRCLEALLAQDLAHDLFEIVVVDDERSALTRMAVEAFARRHRCTARYLCPPAGKRGPAAARNAGWQAARADLIAFTDDDTIPAPDWLRQGMDAMTADVSAAWGHVVVPLRKDPTDAERNIAGLHGAEFVTANCFVRRSALAHIGGFDERFKRAWREDSDLYFSLLEAGHRVVAAPHAIVAHPARTAPVFNCLRLHRNLFFDALLYKKHPALYRHKIAALPPLRYYLAVVLLILAAMTLVAGAPRWAAAMLGAWLAVTLLIVLRRRRGVTSDWREQGGIVLTSMAIPPLAVFWRLAGAWHFRVAFA